MSASDMKDNDPIETQEWIESLDAVLETEGCLLYTSPSPRD